MTLPQLLTISGPPGSGTSTACDHITDICPEYEFLDAGTIFRNLAEERGMTLAEFSELCETDDSIDRKLDERIRTRILEQPDDTPLLVESRLAGWAAIDQPALSIWLDAPQPVRLERTSTRDDNETLEEMQAREESEAQRYQNYYGIDITDLSIYDLTINTDQFSVWGMKELLDSAIVGHEAPDTPPNHEFDPQVFTTETPNGQ